jgi:hypothetical protein
MGVLEHLGRRHLFRTFPPDFDPSLLANLGVGLLGSMQVVYDYWKVVKDDPALAEPAKAHLRACMAKLEAQLDA